MAEDERKSPGAGPPAPSRRTFLRGAGVAMALPWLECMLPACKGEAAAAIPRRMVAIETNMSILPQFFFPDRPGRDFAPTPYLRKLAAVRDQLTVFSGVSHPGVTGAHAAEKCFLTGTPHPERGGFRNGISLDQFAAERVGHRTRYPSLVLAMSGENNQTLSFTRSGAPIPAERSPNRLYRKLFMQGRPDEVAANLEALRRDRSMLDFVADESRRLNRSLARADRNRLDQYFTSVRELERRLGGAEGWEHRPKPRVRAEAPQDIEDPREFVRRTKLGGVRDLLQDFVLLIYPDEKSQPSDRLVDTWPEAAHGRPRSVLLPEFRVP